MRRKVNIHQCQTPCSPPTEDASTICLLLYFTGGEAGVGRGAAAVEVLSPWREPPQHFSLNLSILCCLGTLAEDSSPRAPSSPLGSFIPSGDSSLISLFFLPLFSCPEVASVGGGSLLPPAALTRQSSLES